MHILKGYGTLISALNSANKLRLRLHGGRLLTQPLRHLNLEMPCAGEIP
jgi:hypothetical protein